jgi:flavorubredoxin
VETDGVLVAHASIYGNTAAVAHRIADQLRSKGVEVREIDLCRSDLSEAVSQAFRYGKMVLCAASYDGGVFPPMHAFLYKLGIKGYQSRRVGVVENGTWAPTAGKTICSMLQQMKNIDIVSPVLTIRSTWKEEYQHDFEALVKGVIREECM